MYYFLRFLLEICGVLPAHKRRNHKGRRRVTVRPLAMSRQQLISFAIAEHRGYATASEFIHATSLAVIYERDRGRCGLCKRKVDRFDTGPMKPSIDHIKPLARGGKHAPENLQLSHLRCNLRKGAGR